MSPGASARWPSTKVSHEHHPNLPSIAPEELTGPKPGAAKPKGQEDVSLLPIALPSPTVLFVCLFCLFVSFSLFRAEPVAYGGSQARGQIGAVAADLRHSLSHSNTGSKSRLQPTPQLTVMLDP